MYSLFNSPIVFNPSLNKVSGWNETRRAALDEMNKLAQHYRVTSAFSRNDNILNRILNEVDVVPNKDKDYVAELARSKFNDKAGVMGLFNAYTTNSITPTPYFYGGAALELIVSDDSYFNANEARFDWENLEPIKILDHPFDDLCFTIPDDTVPKSKSEGGIAIISINVPMLVVQFHYWVEKQKEFPSQDPMTNVGVFLTRYPIFNSMKSHLDIAIRNRFFRLYNNEEVSKFLKFHPVAIRDITQLADNSLRNTCKTLRDASMTYEQILMQIPAISWENQLQVLKLPSIPPVRSVKWVLDFTRLRTIRNLLLYEEALEANDNVSVASKATRNIATKIFIKRRLAIMKNDRPVSSPLDQETTELLRQVEFLLG